MATGKFYEVRNHNYHAHASPDLKHIFSSQCDRPSADNVHASNLRM